MNPPITACQGLALLGRDCGVRFPKAVLAAKAAFILREVWMYACRPYDEALEQILNYGEMKQNRTGVRALTIFGILSRYRIDEFFPLLTGRKIKSEAVFAELLWFISGSSNNKDLQRLGANFWSPWESREFEAANDYAEGSLGPVYGFQLRHFDGHYGDGRSSQMHSGENLYGKGGIDQLSYVLNKLKSEPNDRRIIWSLWNPKQLGVMRLPPCHWACQFHVGGNKLSTMLIQRSCDFPVGVPFNIAFYSAMTYMLAQQAGLVPFEFVHLTADSHIYEDQIPAVKEYLARPKPDSPKLHLEKAGDIDSYKLNNFLVVDYNPQPVLKIPVAV